MPDEPSEKKEPRKKAENEQGRVALKRMRETSPTNITSMDAKSASKQQTRGSPVLKKKLNMLLTILPELETYKTRITFLEEENKALQINKLRKFASRDRRPKSHCS